MELDLTREAAFAAINKKTKLADRTGIFSARKYASDLEKDGRGWADNYIRADLHLMIYEAVLHALSDGRTYVVKVGKVETYEEDDATQYRLSAIVALHKPDEAEVGEWVHLGSIVAKAGINKVTLTMTPEPNNDGYPYPYLATFERHKLGWKRVR